MFWEITLYSSFQAIAKGYRGYFKEAEIIAENLAMLEEKYQYVTVAKRLIPAELNVLRGNPKQAYKDAANAVSVSIEKGIEAYGLQAYGWQAIAQIVQGDVSGATESLSQADRIISNRSFWPPLYISSVLLAKFILVNSASPISEE